MAGHFEAKKHAYRQTQDGIVVSFVVHPNDLDASFAVAPLGTRYMIGFSEIGDDEKPIGSVAQLDRARKDESPTEVAGSNPAGVSKPHRPFASLPLSQQCGMRCKDGHFFDFMCATKPELDSSPADLVMNIYAICGITSRSELDTNDIAAAKWRKLEADYQAYLTDLAYAGSIK